MKRIRNVLLLALAGILFTLAQPVFAQCEQGGEGCPLIPPQSREITTNGNAGYFAFRCSEKPDRWYFVPLSDPTDVLERSLAGATDDPLNSSPPILRGNRVYFYPEVLSNQLCVGDLFDWTPICKDLPFWVGPLSPDGRWFGVRTKDEIHPDKIGILTASCFLQGRGCNPNLDIVSSSVAPLGSDRFMTDSAWLQDGSGLIFIVEVDTDRTNQTSERSEIWQYSLSKKSFVELINLQGAIHFRTPRFKFAPPIWSPDAEPLLQTLVKTSHYSTSNPAN